MSGKQKNIFNLAIWFLLFGVSLIFAYYLISNLFILQNASAFPISDGILIYATSSNSTLQYRTYASSTNAFSAPTNAGSAIATTERFIVGASSPTSNEQIIGVWDDVGATAARLTIMRWNGTAWTTDWSATMASSSMARIRGFDIAYYGNSGNAMVVYATSTTNGVLNYRTWNGSSWSATSSITFTAITGAVVAPQWVEVEGFATATSNPRLVLGTNMVNGRFGFAIWSGTAWGQATTTMLNMWSRAAGPAARQFDVGFENTSGDAFAAFGFRDAAGIQSQSCVSGCSSWTANTLQLATDDADFIDIAASPQAGSNDIAIVGSCAINVTGDDVVMATMWTGAGFITGNGNLDAATICDTAGTEGTFPAAVGWYGDSDIAAVYFTDAATAGTIFRSKCTSGCTAFSAVSNITAGAGCVGGSHRSHVVSSWEGGNDTIMMTIIPSTGGNLCVLIDNQSTTAMDPSPGGAKGVLQAAGAGHAANFSFFRANSAPNAPTQDSPANGAIDVSATPTFLMTATDPSADKLGYKVTIYSESSCASVVQTNDQAVSATGWTGTDATCTAAPTACYTSGTQASFLTQTALSASTQYWWKASAKDPDGNGGFTDSSTCNNFTTVGASLTFTVDTPSVFIGSFTPGTPVASSTVLTANTNNASGYNITVNRASTTPTLFFNSFTVADTPNSNNWTAPSATTTVGSSAIWTDGTTIGLGFRIKQTGTNSGAYHSAWWGTDDASGNAKYSGISTSTAAQKISHQNVGSGSNENITVNYRIDVSSNQSSGAYISSPVTYTATVNP